MRRLFQNRRSWLLSVFLVVSVFGNAVVYACSSRHPVQMDLDHSAMTPDAAEDSGPCANQRQDEDICKTVRDRMLSIQPSTSQDMQKVRCVTLELFVTSAVTPVLPSVFENRHAIFHPVFAISLPVSFLVLRI